MSDSQSKTEELAKLSRELREEPDPAKRSERMLLGAQRITGADGATLYRLTDDGKALKPRIVRNTSLEIAMGGSSGKPVGMIPVPMWDVDGEGNHRNVASHVAFTGRSVNIGDAYAQDDFDFSGTKVFDGVRGYASRSFLAVPLHNTDGQLTGVLELINAIDPETEEITAFSVDDQRLAESLAAQDAVKTAEL